MKKLMFSLFTFLGLGLLIASFVPAQADMMKKDAMKDTMMKKVIVSETGYFQQFDQTAFDTAQANGEKILVHINASWCSTCKLQRDVLLPEAISGDYADVNFFSLDFDDDKAFMSQFDVTERSTILMFKNGAQIDRIDRSKDKDLIVSKTRAAFK